MSNVFLISDTHFGHNNILTFERSDGTPLRHFTSSSEMDETMVNNWNRVVGPEDKVYHLGDVGFMSFERLRYIFSILNGTKVLIKGNHDNLKLSQYAKIFKDVRGTHLLDKFVLSHVPLHPSCLDRWGKNIHGHLHANTLDDPRYINVSVECVNYTPIALEEIKKLHGN